MESVRRLFLHDFFWFHIFSSLYVYGTTSASLSWSLGRRLLLGSPIPFEGSFTNSYRRTQLALHSIVGCQPQNKSGHGILPRRRSTLSFPCICSYRFLFFGFKAINKWGNGQLWLKSVSSIPFISQSLEALPEETAIGSDGYQLLFPVGIFETGRKQGYAGKVWVLSNRTTHKADVGRLHISQ